MTNKKTLTIFILCIVLIGYIVFDNISFSHTPTNKLTKILSGQLFATVGMATSSNSVSTTTSSQGVPSETPNDYTDNKNGTITDNYTGLVWLKCTLGTSGNDCSLGSPAFKTWSQSRNDCGNLVFAKKSDWRLPRLKELESIVHTDFSPAINNEFFPGTAETPYWTFTSPARRLSDKFIVLFTDGSVYYNPDNTSAAARCVRRWNF